ncbi:hypothetical protein NDU88_004510 [Pleurodeles waltl]|uniref:Uncharacterized protein n=1 Tax=Pleurodeles waltl TaxID=8319 RepID=A0AAV7SIZ0_PLEWA|nr:hypothetical protein NDU88_004510 [Pleurodeles waltl]
MAESHIHTLQSTKKRMEEEVQYFTNQHTLMAAKLEDQEGRVRWNNIRVVVFPEGAEVPSVDLFLEDLITLRSKRL